MAAYDVELSRSAARDLERLAPGLRFRIERELRRLAIDPRRAGVTRLAGSPAWRSRVGDYRIIYALDDDRSLIQVLRIRHRRDVYRRLG